MELNAYQEAANTTAVYRKSLKTVIGRLNYVILGMNGEAGEVANNVKKVARDDSSKLTKIRRAAIIDELGDTLWYVALACSELGTTLEELAQGNLDKLAERHAKP